MNGDQIVDEVTGEPNLENMGKVTIRSGTDANNTSVIQGLVPNGQFGATLTSNWDINQDDFNDLFIGAPKDGDGAVYVFFGSFLTSSTAQLNTNDADVALIPSESGVFDFGEAVAGVPDIDGDGVVDMLVQAKFIDAIGIEQTKTYVYSGLTWSVLLITTSDDGFNPWQFIAAYGESDNLAEQELSYVLQAYYLNGVFGGGSGGTGGTQPASSGACQCLADIASPSSGTEPDGFVGISDILTLLSMWGACLGGDCVADLNGDGIVDISDLLILVGSWGVCDSDEDGMPDYWEDQYGFDSCDENDAFGDPDADGLHNLGEYTYGTDPFNADTDGDGVSDGGEVIGGSDPTDGSDNGEGPNSENVLYVMLEFGDQS